MIDNNNPHFVTSQNFHGDNEYIGNLFYMKAWYEFYMADDAHKEILHQVGAELQEAENQNPIKLHQLGAEIVSPNRVASIIDDGGMLPIFGNTKDNLRQAY